MSCNTFQNITKRIVCAKICAKKFNESPIASLIFSGYTLIDNSQYFDDNITAQRKIKWVVYSNNHIIYDFGYNNYYDTILELSNGSTYNNLILGDKNVEILTFLESLPNTIIPKGSILNFLLEVIDDSGIISQNISNKYVFIK